MKQLIIVVKPFRVPEVMAALAECDVSACTLRDAKGYGRQKGRLSQYLGSEYTMAFLPKVEISVWVPDDRADRVVERVVKAARTGRIGDGKIFVLKAAWPEPIEF
ncbi:MAG: P-II family nitrogen regulator [Gemmatales bacterium]|nr:P-II family nitrogen regulator [Gemmatales bacterium]MDW8386846.1 P-II family nitrogen regulator [Gemmatales bacterium]